ncbi:alkaline phosphatase family protein [Nocardia fluminea]|uniref:alkaline phosphatase family protein n=1 Tax=Nocardia fluminea TaxID=134984 RepID=UPI0036721A53
MELPPSCLTPPPNTRAIRESPPPDAKGLTWRVYCDAPSPASFTGIIHGARLHERFATNFFTTDRFYEDAARGELPTYSFIEPNLWNGHNDMHPPISALLPGLDFDAPSALLGGEDLLAKVYDAIRTSSSDRGSNVFNTLLMVVFDEHGGTYDHVAPPAANPPDPNAPAGQMDFTFDRLGVRLPAIAISPWISEKTVINDVYRHTSVIRTMRERWDLGSPLTRRDADAPELASILVRDKPRPPEEWPDVVAQQVPAFGRPLLPLDAPLSPLGQTFAMMSLGLVKQLGHTAPDIRKPGDLDGREAIAQVREAVGRLFPGLQSASSSPV